MASTLIGKQAVVIGAGMGGLSAAGALADHFDQVVVLERDTLPSEPVYRAGAPQARHVHALLLSGQRALSELFPGFEQDLARAGAVPLRVGLDVRMERPGYNPFPQRDLGWCSYAASRPTIERAVRQRVESRANSTLRQRCRVQEVLATPNGEAVTGVRYENADGASETIVADLVVDASGRGALTLALLQSIGRPLPEGTTIGIDLGYATCIFAIPDDAPGRLEGRNDVRPGAPEQPWRLDAAA
jgi:2-polyprenyl-6-methoxyphenol hydroxylase-like FAD-dependent oxidoreductase